MARFISIFCGIVMLVSMASVAGWLIRHKNYFPSPQIIALETKSAFLKGGEGDRHLASLTAYPMIWVARPIA